MTRADAGNFITNGFKAGMKIKISGGLNNGLTYTILIVAPTTITFIHETTVINESAGTAITIIVQREKLTRVPVSGIQVIENVSISSTSPEDIVGAAIDSYTTVDLVPGVTSIPVGVWSFNFWAYASSANNAFIHFKVYKVTSLGTETLLFTTGLAEITSVSGDTNNQKYYVTKYTISTPISLLTTDRIMVRVIGTVSSTTKTIFWIYQGTSMASYICTTFNVTAPIGPTGPTGPIDPNSHIQNTDTGTSENFDIVGEISIKVYSQTTEPVLGQNNRMAIWIDTDDGNRVYLIFRRGIGDQVGIELT